MAFAPAGTTKTTINNALNSPIRGRNGSERRSRAPLNISPTRQSTTVTSNGKSFKVWHMSKDVRQIADEVHGTIDIPPAIQIVLDSPPVQRLANLYQLGCAFNTYPSCTHTRKEHSLGVSELAGKIAMHLQKNQEQLGITDMDVLCLRIAGLCHDLGHGPYSHSYEAFLHEAARNERDNPEEYKKRNKKFREEFGMDIPPIDESWAHEKASLMMVDELLASVGLEINWDNLDGPLKQVGTGIDATKFGLVRKGHEQVQQFTSRDWIFIKECINGYPLTDPDAPGEQKDFVGRPEQKEFLYDIVNNRHNGLDMDKVDYYARDFLAAHGTKKTDDLMWKSAAVAWAECPNPKKCFKCKSKAGPGKHLMICYPEKYAPSAMEFFSQRMKNFRNIYTHKKTKSAELHMIDILLEADKHFCMLFSTQHNDSYRLPTSSRYRDLKFPKLPISRAYMCPRMYLRLGNSIIDIVEDRAIENGGLENLRLLLTWWRNHIFYKCVGEKSVDDLGGDKFWKSNSEDDIKTALLDAKNLMHGSEDGTFLHLEEEDFYIEKREIHCGRKNDNPVSQMRFLHKSQCRDDLEKPIQDLPDAHELKKFPSDTPSAFVERSVRVFSRTEEKNALVQHAFESWFAHIEQRSENPQTLFKTFDESADDEEEYSEPAALTQESATRAAAATSPHCPKRKGENKAQPSRTRRKLMNAMNEEGEP